MTSGDPGFVDLARRLEAFSDLRLTPTAGASARMRAEVMSVADRRAGNTSRGGATALAAQASTDSLGAGRRSTTGLAMTGRFGWHRPFAVVLAAGLALGALTGTTYAARAGGALYETRIWVETLTLPGDGVARATAEVARFEARLIEARSAMADGDAAGTVAALAAYTDIVAAATSGANGDAAASDIIEAGVVRQVAVLTKLAGVVPVQARAAIEHALASSTKTLDHLGAESPAGSNGKGPGGDSGGAGPAMSGTAGTGPDDRGDGSTKPAKSPKPGSEPASGPKGPKDDPGDKNRNKGRPASSPPPRAESTPKAPPSQGKP